MKIIVENFMGAKPAIDVHMLPDNIAQTCHDAKIEGGRLKPLRDPATIAAKTTTGTLLSFYRYVPSDIWCEWEDYVDAVPGMAGDDDYERLIYTGDGPPRITWNSIITTGGAPYPGTSYLLGVPPPGYVSPGNEDGTPPVAALVGSATDSNSLIDTRFYVLTSVDALGAEGPPTLASNEIEWQVGQTVDLTIPAIPAGDYNIVSYRVYRTSTSADDTAFQYVGTGTNWGGTFNDSVKPESLAEVLPTAVYDLPPWNLENLCSMDNGFLAASLAGKNVLCFGEIAAPHAWPVDYQKTTSHVIMDIAPMGGNTLLVGTKGNPYIASGTDPASMQLDELQINQSCVSYMSMVSIGAGAVYASPDGLVYVQPDGSWELITHGVYTRDQWQALTPSGIRGVAWEGLYIAWFGGYGFIIDATNPAAGVITLTDYYGWGKYDMENDVTYMTDGASILEFDGDTTYQSFVWKSKVYQPVSGPDFLGAMQIRGDDTGDIYKVTIEADNVEIYNDNHPAGAPFRLPGGYRARKLEVKVRAHPSSTGGAIHGFRAASSMKELLT